MEKLSIEPLVSFLKTLHALQRVERVMHVPGTDRYENDVEHSYTLAMCGWYLIDAFDLPFDKDKVIRYALAHDVLEVYAGDTYIFSGKEHLDSKKQREDAARGRLAKEFPEMPGLHTAMAAYEDGTDAEAIFIRALDKLMPVITNHLQNGRTLKERKISYRTLTEFKRRTTAKSPEVAELLEQLIVVIDQDKGRMFEDRID